MGSADSHVRALTVDARGLPADAQTLDLLARVALTARRTGFRLKLHGSSPELRELIAFAGLEDALPEQPLAV